MPSPGPLVLRLRPNPCGESKVAETDNKVVVLHKDVLRLDVPVHDLSGVDPLESFDQLNKDLSRVILSQMAAWLDLHVVPKVCQRVEWQHDSYVLVLVDDDILNLADALHPYELVHDLDFIFDVLKQILLSDFFDAHVLEALELVPPLVLAEAGNADHA